MQTHNTRTRIPLQPCSVYIIGSTCRYDAAPWRYACKVGMASDVYKRLAQLQIGNPHPLTLGMSIKFPNREIAASVEAAFHTRLDHCAILGEWFAMPMIEAEEALSGLVIEMYGSDALCL